MSREPPPTEHEDRLEARKTHPRHRATGSRTVPPVKAAGVRTPARAQSTGDGVLDTLLFLALDKLGIGRADFVHRLEASGRDESERQRTLAGLRQDLDAMRRYDDGTREYNAGQRRAEERVAREQYAAGEAIVARNRVPKSIDHRSEILGRLEEGGREADILIKEPIREAVKYYLENKVIGVAAGAVRLTAALPRFAAGLSRSLLNRVAPQLEVHAVEIAARLGKGASFRTVAVGRTQGGQLLATISGGRWSAEVADFVRSRGIVPIRLGGSPQNLHAEMQMFDLARLSRANPDPIVALAPSRVQCAACQSLFARGWEVFGWVTLARVAK